MKDETRQTWNYFPEKPVDSNKLDEVDDDCYCGECGRRYDEDGELWIGCDGGCEGWYHVICVGLDEESLPENFYCDNCSHWLSCSFIPLIHCYILHLYTLYSLYTHLYLPFILFIQLFTRYNSPSNVYAPSRWNAPCVPHYLHVFRNTRK